MLEVDSLSKRLAGAPVVRDVSLRVDAGSIATLAGENGAGKSTLLRLIAGVLEPERGAVRLDGQPLVGRASSLRKRIGYVPEAADPPPYLTAGELFRVLAAIKNCEAVSAERVAELGAGELVDRRVGELSLGERRRVCLAAALTGGPALLLLDEPTNGLDPAGIGTLQALLCKERERGAAILLATHDRAFAEAVADQRLSMRAGTLLATPP